MCLHCFIEPCKIIYILHILKEGSSFPDSVRFVTCDTDSGRERVCVFKVTSPNFERYGQWERECVFKGPQPVVLHRFF